VRFRDFVINATAVLFTSALFLLVAAVLVEAAKAQS
jgi:hypothetical protein